jgi:hypothetical protein
MAYWLIKHRELCSYCSTLGWPEFLAGRSLSIPALNDEIAPFNLQVPLHVRNTGEPVLWKEVNFRWFSVFATHVGRGARVVIITSSAVLLQYHPSWHKFPAMISVLSNNKFAVKTVGKSRISITVHTHTYTHRSRKWAKYSSNCASVRDVTAIPL